MKKYGIHVLNIIILTWVDQCNIYGLVPIDQKSYLVHANLS